VKRSDAVGFEVLSCRKNVRLDQSQSPLTRDFERYATTVVAFVRIAIDPHHAQAAHRKRLVMNPNFSDGL
jgi:hypothetical protein